MKRLEKLLTFLFVFLLPTQIAFHFWPDWAYVYGFRVDYLAPTIYLSDLLAIALLFLNFNHISRFLFVHKRFFGLLMIFAFFNTVFSVSPMVSIYRWFKIIEFVFIGAIFQSNKLINTKDIVKPLFYSMLFFSSIGIAQFLKGGSLGGMFYLLGERLFSTGTPGISLVNLGGAEYLRAYSTFPHPNSLAGFIGTSVIFLLLNRKLSKSVSNAIAFFVMLICFVLTFSLNAILGILLVLAFYFLIKRETTQPRLVKYFLTLTWVISLSLPFLAAFVSNLNINPPKNIKERLELAQISLNVLKDNPLFGSGLGTFITTLPSYWGNDLQTWLLQPVHNIYLLVFSELGGLGIGIFIVLLYKLFSFLIVKKKQSFLLIFIFTLFVGLSDHYNLTLQQNNLLLSILIGLSLR